MVFRDPFQFFEFFSGSMCLMITPFKLKVLKILKGPFNFKDYFY